MPTYDYKCDACGLEFERFQSIAAKPIRKCPKCGKIKLRRLIGPGAGLIFKGSGFYTTDYRSEGYKNAAKGESGSGDKAAATDGKASDAKAPAAKPAESKPAASSDAKKKSS